MGLEFHSGCSSVLIAILHLVLILALLQCHEAKAANGYCDLFKGSWAQDQSYPLYNPSICPFIEREFACQRNGRPDQIYTKYKWQPQGCDLKR